MSQIWYSAEGRIRINKMNNNHLNNTINKCEHLILFRGDIYYNNRRYSQWIKLFKEELEKRKPNLKILQYKIY